MSLITSCPACGTMFRVVPDQLKISEGWVRCGHCAEVFDATAYLLRDAPPLPGEVATEPAPFLPDSPGWQPTSPPGSEPFPTFDFTPDPEPPARMPGAATAQRLVLPGVPPEDPELDAPFTYRRPDPGPDSQPEPAAPPPSVPAPAPSRPAELRRADAEPDLDDVSFVRAARRRAFWRRPLVRFGMSLLALLLLAALLLQVAYHERDRLAALHPPLAPWLARLCEPLACTISAPRQIESIVIESSGFARVRGDTYRLSFTLRNTSALDLAAPALELTLTDTQDMALVRRVLLPAELGTDSGRIAAAGDWSGTVGVQVNAGGMRIAGYRLLAFYP